MKCGDIIPFLHHLYFVCGTTSLFFPRICDSFLFVFRVESFFTLQYRQLIQHYSKLPHIYGLPKIHKNDIPLRSIVSNRGSAFHPLSRFIVEIINPLTGKSSSYVKTSAHFVERISDAPIHSNQMLSLDVVSLFTKISTDETLAVVWDKMAADPLLE